MRSLAAFAGLITIILGSACDERGKPADNGPAPVGTATTVLQAEAAPPARTDFEHRLEYREAVMNDIEEMSQKIRVVEQLATQSSSAGARAAHAKVYDLYQKRERLIQELDRLPYVSQAEWAEYYGGIEAGRLDLRVSLTDAYAKLEPAT